MSSTGIQNQITQPIYDTVQLAVAAVPQTANFFVNPLNTVLVGAALKSYAHTNLVQSGRLESGLRMSIRGLTLFVRDLATAGARVTFVDYVAVYNNSHINLLKAQVSFLRIPAYLLPAGGAEVNYFSNIAPAATEFKTTHGLGSFMNRFVLDSPFDLEANESIQVVLQVDGAIVAVTDVTVVLWGEQIRAVL